MPSSIIIAINNLKHSYAWEKNFSDSLVLVLTEAFNSDVPGYLGFCQAGGWTGAYPNSNSLIC